MNIIPVVIDSRPAYLTGHGRSPSLLLVPLGTGTLIEHLLSSLDAGLTHQRPFVLAPAGADSDYRQRLSDACPLVDSVSGWAELTDALGKHEPSDAILMIDPRCLPTDGSEFEALLPLASADPRWAVHLVAFDKGVGTKEFVHFDSTGRVRRIQRYYDAVTWPFIAGVAASLLPVSSGVIDEGFAPTSLWDLRTSLTIAGVPSRDLEMTGSAHDLSDEAGFLSASEQFILKATSARTRGRSSSLPLLLGGGHQIHPSARMIGPVIIHDGAIIKEHVTVVGPTLIGAGACVLEGAVLAQAFVGPDCVVPTSGLVRQRALFVDAPVDSVPVSTSPRRPAHDEETSPAFTLPIEAEQSAEQSADLPADLPARRLFDTAIAAISLIILSPILALVGFLIRCDSDGSIFYGHQREGRDGRVFRCWKFRTMYEGAEARQRTLHAANVMDGPQFKLVGDPRITRMGRILRATNIDEIPQLFNVLLGEMSLVGPRPSPFRENQYCVPWRVGRLSVRPGITGLWQVCRHDREVSDFHQWIEYDLLYVRHASLLLDLKILTATILTLGGKRHVPLSWMVPIEPAREVADLRGSI